MKLLDSLEKYILLTTLFFIPLVFLPIFPNAFDTPKIAVLAFGVSLVLVIKAIKTIVKGTWEISSANFDIPVILLALSYLIAALVKSPNKLDAFFLPGSATIVVGSAIFYLLLNNIAAKDRKSLAVTIFASATTVALISLVAFSGILTKVSIVPAFLKDSAFNTLGGALPSVIFFGITMFLGLGMVLSEKEIVKKALAATATLIVILALVVSFLNILPGKASTPSLPPFDASWAVAIETLKESPLLGVGAGNYLSAFNRFRSVTYNSSKFWAVRFTGGADFLLTTLTETGLLGLAAFLILIFVVGKLTLKEITSFKTKKVNFSDISYLLALVVSLIVVLALPASLNILVLVFALLSLNASVHKSDVNLISFLPKEGGTFAANRILPFIIAIPVLVAIGFFYYFGSRAIFAEYQFNQSLTALAKNDGKGTYDLLISTITLDPYVDRYHATFSQINLALASSLAQNLPAGRQEKTLTDSDKNTISQLIQQAITEGKATVTLNPQRSDNWELLARTYQAIMPFAQGADQLAIQTFNQSIALDPINPNLRIALGGLYYALGRFDDAIQVFQLATLAKPDLANAHYNLALAYREKGEFDKAITEINNVLSLVDKNSQDYQLAKDELDNLNKKKPATTTTGSENLTAPTKVASPTGAPVIILPTETPTPTPIESGPTP